MKILVIDDEKPTRSMFKLFLTAYGYEVYTSQNGETGLETFKEIHPPIVFTDIKMPGIDGLEVLRQIRRAAPSCQVIVITGHGDMDKAVQALDLNASDFINKPVERQALDSALARAEARIKLDRLDLDTNRPFDCDITVEDHTLEVRIKGRVSELAKEAMDSIFDGNRESEIQRVSFYFDESFSISKKGIELLMETMGAIRTKKIPIVVHGLSHSFLRFFQMAGMGKLVRFKTDFDPVPFGRSGT